MNEPKLRFKADDGNEFPKWEEYKANQLFDNIVDKGHPSETVLTIVQGTGTVPRSKSGRNLQYDVEYLSNYKRVQKNDFIIHLRSFEGGLEMANEDGIVSPAYTILRSKFEIAPPFYYAYFHTNSFIHHNLAKAVEGIRDGRQISYEAFKELNIPRCSLQEQNKIAEILTALNKTMDQTQSEVEAWEKQKRGVMQMLFSRKVRFKADDGSEFPEWEERRLDECCEVFTDGDWIESKDQSNSGVRLIQTGNIGVTEYFDKPNNMKWISESTFLKLHCKEVFPGDILISRLPAPAGRACIVPDLGVKMITAVDCTIIRTTFDCNKEFLVQYLATPQYFNQVNSALAGGTRQRISRGNLAEIMIPYPCIEEQQKIAACLSGFDDVIDKAKKELGAYRQLKKGLLQQMFV